MKRFGQSTVDTLILAAASDNGFGITKPMLTQELVLTYRKVNHSCERLVQKRMLNYNSITRTYCTTPLGREIIKLTADLASHCTPFNDILAKYESRIKADKIKIMQPVRRTLKETYADNKSRLATVAAGAFLTIEQLFTQVDGLLMQLLLC